MVALERNSLIIQSPYNTTKKTFGKGKNEASAEIHPQVQALYAYFDALDGSPQSCKRALDLFGSLFHRDLQFVISSSETSTTAILSYSDLEALVFNFCRNGGKAKIQSLQQLSSVSLDETRWTAVIHNFLPDKEDALVGYDYESSSQQTITFDKDYRICHVVVAGNPGMKNLVDELESRSDPLLKTFRDFITSFDGTPGAAERARPHVEKLHHPDARLFTGVDSDAKNVQWLLDFCRSFEQDGNVAILEELERTETGLKAVIRNIVKGVDMGAAPQYGIVNDQDQIIYWQALPGQEFAMQSMVDRVLADE